MEYIDFFLKLQGYNIICRKDKSVVSKSGFYHRYKEGCDFDILFNDVHPDYFMLLKDDFKIVDGEVTFCGILEGAANPARLYKHCPEKKPEPLKRVYEKKSK